MVNLVQVSTSPLAIPAPRHKGAHQESILSRLWQHQTTRRGFLIGVGGSLPLVGGLVRAASNFSHTQDKYGVSLTVSDLPVWRVDTRWFDGQPRVKVHKSAKALRVSLCNARFPGTDIAADMTLTARRAGGDWRARFTFAGLGFGSEVSLPMWLLGVDAARGAMNLTDVRLGSGNQLTLGKLKGDAWFRADWTFDMPRLDSGTLVLDGRPCAMSALRMELDNPSDIEPAFVPELRHWAALSSGAGLTVPLREMTLEFADTPARAYLTARRDRSKLTLAALDGDTTETLAKAVWRSEQSIAVPVGEACARIDLGKDNSGNAATGHWSNGHWLVAHGMAMRLSPPQLARPIELAAAAPVQLDLSPEQPIVDQFVLTLPGCDLARFVVRGNGTRLGRQTAQALSIDDVSRKHLLLDAYSLVLRRASDALFCTVRFRGLKLERRHGLWALVQADAAPGLIEFDLGAQHLLEEAVYFTGWTGCAKMTDTLPTPLEAAANALLAYYDRMHHQLPPGMASLAAVMGQPFPKLLEALSNHPNYEAFCKSDVVRPAAEAPRPAGLQFEAAAASHLTFSLKSGSSSAPALPLTMESLFGWSDDGRRHNADRDAAWLDPILPKRALPAGVDRLPGNAAPLKADVTITRPQSLANQPVAGLEYATGIEAPARLVISPIPPHAGAVGHDKAPWLSPLPGPEASPELRDIRAELWYARLMGAQVRAVFTPDAAGIKILGGQAIDVNVFAPPPPYDPSDSGTGLFRASLDNRDRHELVALSALFGFEALCDNTTIACLANTKVGYYRPLPINAKLLLLSSQGASFKYNGAWMPPATAGSGALSLQRYIHTSQIGRDIFVRCEYKGFLFPLGHPAILVKQTERLFCMDRDHKQSVAALVQRFFIRVPAFSRAFPALGQPDQARLWGHASIAMAEFTTPNLVDPQQTAFVPDKVPPRLAFWPTIPGAPNKDVLFEFEEPGAEARYRAPMVWIDNHVAHSTQELGDVVTQWRSEVGTRLAKAARDWPPEAEHYFAEVLSARLPYLPGKRGQNTDLETSKVLLGVQVPGETGYADLAVADPGKKLCTTPAMEGELQPPFYPVRRRAKVASTRLDTLSGQHGGAYLLEFDPVYGANGMSAEKNAAHIYGIFTAPGPMLDFSNDTSRSGGVASPSAQIVWMSESRGPLGGAANALVTPGVPQMLEKAHTSDVKAVDVGQHDNGFDPKSYFAAFLGDAKLLGVVRLVDILEAILSASGLSVPTIKQQDLFDLPLDALRELLPAIDARLAKFDETFSGSAPSADMPIAVVTRLLPAWNRLRTAVRRSVALVAAPSPSVPALLAQAGEIASAANKLATEIKVLTNDPVLLLPPVLAALVGNAETLMAVIKGLLPPAKLIDTFVPLIEELVAQRIQERLDVLATELLARPAYASVRAAIVQFSAAVAELKAAATDAMVLMQAIETNLLSRLLKACTEVLLQMDAVREFALDSCQALGGALGLALERQHQSAQVIRAKLLGAEKKATWPLTSLHAGLDDCTGLVATATTISPEARTHVNEALLQARQAVSAISDAINAQMDRLDRLDQAWVSLIGQLKSGAMCGSGVDPKALEVNITLARDGIDAMFDFPDLAWRLVERMAELIGTLEPALKSCNISYQLRTLVANNLQAMGTILKEHALSAALEVLANELKQAQPAVVQKMGELIATAATAAAAFDRVLFDATDGVLMAQRYWDAAIVDVQAGLQTQFAPQIATYRDVQQSHALLTQMLHRFSPKAIEAAARAAVDTKLDELRRYIREQFDTALKNAIGTATALFCDAAGTTKLGDAAAKLKTAGGNYLSQDAAGALQAVADAVANCSATPNGKGLEDIAASLSRVAKLLGSTFSSGNIGQIVKLQTVLDQVIADIGIPTSIQLSYDWDTEVFAYPKGNDAIFEPEEERRLVISAVIDASLHGGAPSVTMKATLSPFTVNLFGKSGAANFLSISFDGLRLASTPGGGMSCVTAVRTVQPGVALGFVDNLSKLFGFDSGFYLFPSLHGIRVGYQFAKEYDIVAGLVLQNLALSIEAELPFDNSPVRVTMKLSDKERPFLISAGIYGGGGFLSLKTRADTLEILEASFEYGGVVAFAYGPARGAGRVTAGIYIRMGGRDPVIEGFFCAQGDVTIADLINMSAALRVSLTYHTNTGQASGTAVYTFRFSIGFFDFDYKAQVDYARNGDRGPSGQAQSTSQFTKNLLARSQPPAQAQHAGPNSVPSPKPVPAILEPLTWRRYWRAFAPPNPDENVEVITVWRKASVCQPRNAAALQALERSDLPPGAMARIDWMLVPWGFTENAGVTTLKIGVRVMPKWLDRDGAASADARSNWPRFIARVHDASFTCGTSCVVDIGAHYLARLAELGLTLAEVEALWAALFPAELALPKTARANFTVRARHYKLHDSAEIARGCALRSGSLFADALGNLKAPDLAKIVGNGVVRAPIASTVASQMLLPLAMIYRPVTQRRRNTAAQDWRAGTAAFTAAHPDSANSAVIGWLGGGSNIMNDGHKGLFDAPDGPLNYLSDAATAFLQAYLQNQDLATSSVPDTTRLSDPLAMAMVLQKIAYTSDVNAQDCAIEETFHDRLAGLSAHPWLLKVLGLVVDIDLPVAASEANKAGTVMLNNWSLAGVPVTPAEQQRTHYTSTGFPEPAKKEDKIASETAVDGVLDISAKLGGHLLTQIDIDRTPQRLLQLAIAYQNAVLSGQRGSDVAVQLQAQETVGLSLIDVDPATRPPQDSGTAPVREIYLQHLTLGYRPDLIRLFPNTDPSGATTSLWTSLMSRKIRRVRLKGRDISAWFDKLGVDEGILVPRTRRVESANAPQNAAELIEGERFRWGTWVLGVPRPDTEGAPLAEAPLERPACERQGLPAQIEIEYDAVPGATAQRYGSGYRVGMRLVMVDGSSVALEDAQAGSYRTTGACTSLGDDDQGGTDAERFGFAPFLRYEPVAPPQTLLVERPERERFPNESASKVIVASGGHAANRERTRRVLAPPRCASIDLAIRHGMFDCGGILSVPPASAFPDVHLTARGEFPSFSHGVGDSSSEDRYYRSEPGASAPQVPYYPDPWATRLILGFYRAADDCLLAFDYFDYYDADHVWPNARVLELELIAVPVVSDPVLGFEAELIGNRMVVKVAAGVRLSLRTWHEIDIERLNQSAIVDQMVVAALDPANSATLLPGLGLPISADKEAVRAAIVAALSQWEALRAKTQQTARPANRPSKLVNLTSFWMLNPAAEMELMHAMPLPLRATVLAEASGKAGAKPLTQQLPAHASGLEAPFEIARAAAETRARFTGHLRLHRPSTSDIEAIGFWSTNGVAAVRNPKTGAFVIPAKASQVQLFCLRGLAEVARDDTGAPPTAPMTPELTPDQHLQRLDARIPVSPARPFDLRDVTAPFDFGDTRAHVLEIELRARSRFAAQFAGAAQVLVSPRKRVIAPATERPQAPHIEYVIPLLNWSTGEQPNGRARHTREPGWMRIWLGKSWYSSGNGELLALCCWPDSLLDPAPRRTLLSRTRETPYQFSEPAEGGPGNRAVEALITRWGLDPLARQDRQFGNLPASALRNRLRSLAGVSAASRGEDATLQADLYHLQDMPSFEPQVNLGLASAPEQRVALALYRPQCDPVTGRWYADLQIDPQYAYCPFVRLALARYQPHALPELRMSEIIASEFIQLLPERSTSVIPTFRDNPEEKHFKIVVAGTSLASDGHALSTFAVEIEQQVLNETGWYALPAEQTKARQVMQFDAKEQVWWAEVSMKHKLSHNYSVVIEEYEQLCDEAGRELNKLVYFDRIALLH